MSKTLIIVGSARSTGDTMRVARHLQQSLEADLVDLKTLEIGYFRYDQQYPATDEFLNFIEAKLLAYDSIVLASPVYWYTMSARMKTFLDRFSDLLKSRKELGRQLRGKTLSTLSVCNDATTYESFFLPFRLSADYLGMQYGTEWHGWLEEEVVVRLKVAE